jgi:hypothetical protein
VAFDLILPCFGASVAERIFAGSGIWPGDLRHGAGRRAIPVETIAATSAIGNRPVSV